MRFHVDAPAAKTHSLGFKLQALLDGVVTTQLDLSVRAEHALPWQTE